MTLTDEQKQKLTTLASELVNQEAARELVAPQDRSTGYWFGGGNVVQDRDGSILIAGRYRNYGDSRTGVGAGERGLELAVFRAPDVHGEFEKILSFSKADLAHSGMPIVSIEGVALHLTEEGIELFIFQLKNLRFGHLTENSNGKSCYRVFGNGFSRRFLVVKNGIKVILPHCESNSANILSRRKPILHVVPGFATIIGYVNPGPFTALYKFPCFPGTFPGSSE